MKRILLYLLLGFCCIHVGIKINALIGEKGKGEQVEKPAEDPKSLSAAHDLKNEALKREKEARKEFEEAKTDAEKEKSELKVRIAQRDQKTADIFIDRQNIQEERVVYENEEKAQEYEERVKEDQLAREKIDTEISSLKAKLSVSYQPPQQGQVSLPASQTYIEKIFVGHLQSIKSSAELNDYLNATFSMLTEPGIYDYADQARRLDGILKKIEISKKDGTLSTLLNQSDQEEKKAVQDALQQFTDKANKRIAQIKEFLSNPPPKPITQVAKRLKLDQKMFEDQKLAIEKERNKILTKLQAAVKSKNIPELGKALDSLRELMQAAQQYGFTPAKYSDVDLYLSSIIKAYDSSSKEIKNPQEFAQDEGFFSQFMKIISDWGQVAVGVVPTPIVTLFSNASDTTSKLLVSTVDKVVTALNSATLKEVNGLKAAIKSFTDVVKNEPGKQLNKELQDVAKGMDKYQKVYPVVETLLLNVIDGAQFVVSLIGLIPRLGQLVTDKLTVEIEIVEDGEKKKKRVTKLSQIINNKILKKMGKVYKAAPDVIAATKEIGSTALLVQNYAKSILPILQEIKANLSNLTPQQRENVQQDLDQAIRLSSQQVAHDSKYDKVFEPLSQMGSQVWEFLKDEIQQHQKNIQLQVKTYDDARVNYLKKLGFSEAEIIKPLSADQVKKKLLMSKLTENAEKLAEIDKAQKDYEKALTDLGNIYSKYIDQLKGIMSYYEFVIKGWDSASMEQPSSYTEFVNAILDLRDLRMSYLDSIEKGINDLNANVVKVTEKSPLLKPTTDQFVNGMSGMIADERVNKLADFEDLISKIDTDLRVERNQWSEFIKKSAQQSQQQGEPPQ